MEEKYKKIESYLGGDMTAEEVALFESVIKQDTDLQKEESVRTFLQGEEAQQLKDKIIHHGNAYNAPKKEYPFKKYLQIAAVLAIGILSIVVFKTYNSNTPEQLYVEYYKDSDLPSLVKRDHNENFLYKGISKYKEANYRAALDDFESYQKSEIAIDTSAYIYIGMTHLNLNQYTEAITAFDIMANSQLIGKSKGLWFKALAYVKRNDIEGAKNVLEEILKDTSNFNYKEAENLLDQL